MNDKQVQIQKQIKELILKKLAHLRSMVGSMLLPEEIQKKASLIAEILKIEILIKNNGF